MKTATPGVCRGKPEFSIKANIGKGLRGSSVAIVKKIFDPLPSFLFPFGNHITPASYIFSNMPDR